MKNLNLIKRLWTDSHEKQKPQRFGRYVVMLMMLLTLGVGQMWGGDYAGGAVYFDNSVTNWSYTHVYLIIGKDEWSTTYQMEPITGTSYYHVSLPKSGWSDAKYIAVAAKNGSQEAGNWSDINSKFTKYSTKKSQSGGLSQATYILTPSSSSNGFSFTLSSSTSIFSSCPTDVLNGTKIMVYAGEAWSWDQGFYRFMSSNNTSNTVATAAIRGIKKSLTNIGEVGFGPALLASGTYYQGHWNSGLSKSISAGKAYMVYSKDKASDIGTALATSGDNSLYNVTKVNSSPTTSVTTTIGSSSFAEGTSSLSVSTGSAGKSVMNSTNTVEYYLYNGSTWSKVTVSAGSLNVSSLTEGTYKLATVLYDGYIYVKADEDDFEVTSASIATLTYHANYRTESGGGSGSAPAADEVSIGGTATVAGKGSMTWDTYTFVGWNTEEHYSGSGTLYKEGDKIEMDEDLDLYGMWTRPIPLDDQGATKAVVGDVYGTYNSSYLPPYTNPEKTGYTFNGWYTKPGGANNEVITKEKAFTKDNTNWTSNYLFSRPYTSTSSLYAKWTQTVTLNANTANHGVSPNRSATATWNATSVSSMTHTTAATGYRLDGYYTAATGGTKIINSDKSLVGGNVIVSGDTYLSSGKWQHAGATTLWAQYTPIQYTITFNPNGGSVDPTSRSVTYDAAITSAPVPTKTGYTFTGYNTAGGVSITTNAGVFKANVDGFTDASAHWIKASGATITAQWTEKKVSISPTVNATGDAQGYTASATVGSIGIATTTVLTADAPGEGYRFSGWTLSSNLVITSGSVTDRTITVRTNGDGEAVSARADYEIDTYVRIYFRNTESWSGTISAYVWYEGHDSEEGGKNAAWPGQATSTETICGITYNYYEFNREDHPNWDKIIFNNNGSNQTSNLDVAGHNRLYYKQSDKKWYVPTNTFYFVNTEFWDEVKLYHFGGTNGTYLGGWPGRAMDKIGTVTIDGHEYDYYGIADGICSNLDGSYIINNGEDDSSKKQTSDISSISNYLGSFFVANKCFGASSSPSDSDKPSGSWYDAEGVHNATIGCPALLPFADINSISLSEDRVPPGASITATPNMNHKRDVDQAYCWGVYSDAACTSPVSGISFNSLGAGRVQFTVPEAQATYYLKLTVRASAACNAAIDDEEVQSFQVTTSNMVFFNNSATKWSGVYVYFLGDTKYWSDEGKGSGCKDRDYGRANQMHRIGKSDIYFYEYSGNALGSNDVQYIAFTEYGKPDATDFAYTNAAYRGDFARGCAPMYVPENWVTDRLNYCEYYNRGYWTTYGVNGVARNSGFTLKVFDAYNDGSQVASETLSNTDGSNTYRATVNLSNPNWQYGYQLLSCGNKYYGNDGAMTAHNSSNWKFEPDKRRCGLDSKAVGKYIFIVQCTDGGEVRVSVEYPLVNGDYRLLYNDTCVYQAHAHPSQFIRQNYSDENVKLDTVSMYIRPDKQPVLTIQRCTNASSAPPTWENVGTYDVTGLTNGHGVYNFYISQAVSSGALTINGVSPYTGLYYIRTQQVDGGWYSYENNSDNEMTYTEYAEQRNYGFNYYKAKWIGTTGADVTFTIACDYSESLCDTMVADPGNNPLNASQARSIPHTASVRFGWNSKTNTLHRAYINGTSIVSDRYLVMIGDAKMKDEDGNPLNISGLNPNEINFTDLNNWIYRCDIQAQTGAAVRLVANYDGYTQDFIGSDGKPEEIIGGSSGEWYLMRVTYDFKTNRLMTAWLPNGERITENVVLNADMMLIREGQEAATQVFFNGSGKSVSEIHTIFGVLEFNSENFINKFPNWSATNAYKYLMYYISFPFEVKVSEIFGCGVRGKNWIIQKYNGAKRAKIGWFAETSTFWETLPGDSVLHPYEGYLLILDRISFNDGGSKIWENLKSGGSVYLYFPSASNTSGTISEDEVTIKVPEHTCTINRSFEVDGVGTVNHKNTDSHWNVIGTPLFENKVASEIATPAPDGDGVRTLQYYYAWNSVDNTLVAQDAFDGEVTFKSMHAYMVQYAGDVTFSGAKLTPPASVAAHRVPGEKKNYRIKLRMENESGNSSDAFVELRENACDTFALNEDMYMMRSSSKADLYTFAGNYDVAANVLSMNNHIVPVGTDVKVAGTYRFTMPSDFSGTVTLVDTETGIRTNLALSDYEVSLPKGTSNTRFLLEIDIHQMPTAIDGVGGSLKDGKAHKFIQNGQMYILQNGIIYDAQGKRVK